MKLRLIGIAFSLCIVFFSCSPQKSHNQVTRFHDDGRAKPIVALIPVFDRSSSPVGWSLSEEFTDQLRSRLRNQNKFFLNTSDEINGEISQLNSEDNPFSSNADWIKNTFQNHEFIIFTELVEHDIHSKSLKGNFLDKITPSSELSMIMRIRVFDLRGEKPEVILQEFVHQNHLITMPSNINELNPERWKKVTFNLSPLGIAHAQLSKEVAKRIEDYILISKGQ